MIYTTTLTQKGQATIPAEIRQFLGIKPYEKIIFIKKNSEVILKSAKNFFDLKGSIRTRKKYSDTKTNRIINQFIAKEYVKKKAGS